MYIENDLLSSTIQNKNRCYVWDRIKRGNEIEINEDDNNFDDLVVNDEYAGKTKKKIRQQDDPANAMIVLTAEQELQNKTVISLIKQSAIWFLQEGPKGTIKFFYHCGRKNFLPQALETKIRCLKTYLLAISSIICKDFLDNVFIENVKMICQCVLFGSLHRDAKQEKAIPFMIRSNWVYMIMWVSKDIVLSNAGIRLEKDNRIIESKVLDILDQLACNKLNSQVKTFLKKFRQFQEISLDPGVDDEEEVQTFDVENEF